MATTTTGTQTRGSGDGAQQARPLPEGRNRLVNIAALTLFKIGDGLVDPKIVLAWLMGAAGVPAVLTGALVPVREAGALLPQLSLQARVRAAARRGPLWAAGAAGQGLAALGIGWAALALEGWAAGLAVLGLLALLSLARAICSISHKDALARTVAKARRGRISGIAASAASACVLGFGAALATGLLPLTREVVAGAVIVSGGLFLAAGAVFAAGLVERPERGTTGANPGLADMIRPLREDPALARFVAVRAALTPTAFALPFLVLLSGREAETGLGALGPLVLASAAASIGSAWIWGRLADRSSRLVLVRAGLLAGATLAAAAAAGWTTGGLGGPLGAAGFVFVAQIAYEGVRMGRKIHLTDMAGDDRRALYTALSNTAIGGVLLAGALLGGVADLVDLETLLVLLAGLCLAGAALATGLGEVQAGRRGG